MQGSADNLQRHLTPPRLPALVPFGTVASFPPVAGLVTKWCH